MDPEIYSNLLRKILKPGDKLYHDIECGQEEVVFVDFDRIWYGRLANPGCEPGLYLDRNILIVKNSSDSSDSSEKKVKTRNITFEDHNLLSERQGKLAPGWERTNLSEDCLKSNLPTTQYIESDVVTLIDSKHPNYLISKDATVNQYTVYRVDYTAADSGNPKYRLRAGKVQFDADEKQLQLAAHGPIRIFSSENHVQLHWRSLKDEAEFHLLQGKYSRIFNEEKRSYKWDLAEAKKQISLQNGDGVLKISNSFEVIKFTDRAIGAQVCCDPNLILDI